jgi:carbon monoxide dehydrogenase subunit G
MKLANEFTVHVPIDVAWRVLTDLEGIAPCLPGAQLTGVDGDVYRGKVKVKVGPVISEFAGTARFAEKDDSAYRGVIDAKGRDARSAGNAAALITAQLRADGASTVVNVDTDLKISGKLAQFGSGMIKEVSQKLLGQFVTSLEAKIAADNSTPAPAAPPAPTPAPNAADATPTLNASAATLAPDAGGAATDGQAGADIAAARDLAGDEAPLNAAPEAVRPSTPVLEPGGSAPLAAVGDPVAVPEKGFVATPEPEPLDLMEYAGGSIRKRVVPVVIGVVVVVAAIVVWRIVK